MAFPIIDKAVSKIVFDAERDMINELMTYLESKKVNDNVLELISDFKNSRAVAYLAKKPKKDVEKKKRVPKDAALFIKAIMPDIKEANPDVKKLSELRVLAAEAWKSPEKIIMKEKIEKMKAENPTMYIEEIYDIIKNRID